MRLHDRHVRVRLRPGLPLLFCAVIAALALVACRPAPPGTRPVLTPVAFSDLPGWEQDDMASALPALLASCRVLARAGPAAAALAGGDAGDWQAPCQALAAFQPGAGRGLRGVIEAWFQPYALTDGTGADGLFTGYYEPDLRGSRQPGGAHTVPLYGVPADLVTVDAGLFRDSLKGEHFSGKVENGQLRPYDDRGAIAAGALTGRAPVLAWVDDAVDAFFLQIQGSGRIQLAEGGSLHLGFAAQNGRPYVPIGRILVARGAIPADQVSLQTIRAWLAGHPAETPAILAANPSYVFFREIAGDGPIGSEGVPLTPGRSLAVDKTILPLGLPLWLDAEAPVGQGTGGRLRRLVVAQDTGGAIRGIIRGDLFWGHGPEAEAAAGTMKSRGRVFVLLPRGG